MKTYTAKAWDGLMHWNLEYYTFQAENDEEAEKMAEEWFNEDYLPEVLDDPRSYSDYPDEEDYEDEEEYEEAVREAYDELRAELFWEWDTDEESNKDD